MHSETPANPPHNTSESSDVHDSERVSLGLEALSHAESAHAAEHQDPTAAAEELIDQLCSKGDFNGAESACRKAFQGYVNPCMPYHFETLMAEIHLKRLLKEKKADPGTCPLNDRTVKEIERLLDPNRQDTPYRLIALADHYRFVADIAPVERLYRLALAGFTRFLGPDHKDTLMAAVQLTGVLNEKEEYEESIALSRRLIAGYERTLGPEDFWTLRQRTNLAYVLSITGEKAEALSLHRHVLTVFSRTRGHENYETLQSANDLAVLLGKTGRTTEAVELLRSYATSDECLRVLRYNLACYECQTGDTEKAKKLIGQWLEENPDEEDRENALEDQDLGPIHDFIRKVRSP